MPRTERLWVSALAVFVALSAADFTQTYALIHTGDGAVYEANPVAAPWLERYGWPGLAAYKVAAVLAVAGVVVLLAGRSRRMAAGVAAAGCVAVLTVTLYSRDLIANGRPAAPPAAEEVADEWSGYAEPVGSADVQQYRAARLSRESEEPVPAPGVVFAVE